MNSRKHTSGPTGFGWARSLLTFRHRNPVARFLSALVAFAMATLLVVGSGAAYGSDTTPPPDPTATTTADPTATDPAPTDTSTPTVTTTDPTPATDPTPSTDPAPSTSPATTTTTTNTEAAPKKTMSALQTLTAPLTALLPGTTVDVPCNYNAPSAIAVPTGKFEIDGNLCLTGDPVTPAAAVGDADWESLAYGDPTSGAYKIDELGDTSGFTEGSSETSNPQSWVGGHTPNAKNDIETAWGYSHLYSGKVYAYFAFTSSSQAGGTQEVNMEYNQKQAVANGAGDLQVPDRTVGDLLFHFSMNGSQPLSFSTVLVWTLQSDSSWSSGGANACTAVSGYSPAAGWCPVTNIGAGVFHSAVSSNGQFAEGSINISDLPIFSGKCSGEFGTMQMRTTTGNSWSSAMKDYVGPLEVTTPSTCGKIIINKVDENGNALGGATFSVSPNPTPGVPNATPYSITDNDAKDKNPAPGIIEISPVDPGESYTVTETGSPTGYMIDNPLGTSVNPQTVGTSETKTFNFVDHRIWKGLTATKTANPTYKAEYAWSINKEISANGTDGWTTDTTSASPLIKKVAAGSADSLYYRVTVTEGARTTSLYKVSGTISVTNPADNVGSMNAVVTDDLSGADCLVDDAASKSITVNKGAKVDVPYVCTFSSAPTAGQLSGTNTAHVTWDRSTYPQVVGDLTDVGGATRHVDPTANYDFANAVVTEVNKTVTVTDNKHTFDPAWTITWSAQGHTTTSDVYSQTVAADPGSCSTVFANTATVTGDTTTADLPKSDSAYGKVCEGADLTITRIDARAFTRTYPWSIEKSTTTPKITSTDGTATGSYDVTVTAGDGVDGPTWSMTGTITVHNPNDWEPVSVTSLPVTYSGGGTCEVTGESFPVVLTANDGAAGGTDEHAFNYSCDFGGVKPNYTGNITARANWSQAAAFTPSDHVTDTLSITEANWTKTLVNSSVTVVDNHATVNPADDTTWTLDWATVYAMTGHKTVLHYTIPLAVPDGGTCAVRTNTVKILGDGSVELDADNNAENNSADVQVCNPIGLSVTKTAVGDFTRTYPWTLEKFINTDQKSQTVHIDTYDHDFSYKVKATPGTPVDSAWEVTGTIKVHNDNTSSDIDPITVTSLSDVPAIGAAASCVFDKGLPFQVASGADVYVNYDCTFATKPTNNTGGQQPTYGGTNTATVGWGTSGSASSPATTVDWQAPTEVDKSLPIYDDKVNLPTAQLIGTATWNAAHDPTVVDYTKNLSVPESTAGSCAPAQTNTAWLGGTADTPSDLKDSTDAIICVNAGTWSVSKVNVDGNGPVATDSDVTYRLTAHKTGGSNPKNVVLYDDLSDIAPYVTLPTQSQLTAAAPAGSTATISGNVITWTIAELGSTDQTLDFTVHVNANAYGVNLPNLVTSPGSDNCPNPETTTADCRTDNVTPHYTLRKSSDAGAQVMPPYLGADGTLITYTLTVHNDSQAPINSTTMPNETVTDDLTDVLDNATWVGNITPADGSAVRNGNALTWTLPAIPVDGTATLTYQVRVAGDQWDTTLTNVAAPGNGGDCYTAPVLAMAATVVNPNCTTTTRTPGYALIQALKVDADNPQQGLQGAVFTLSQGEQVLEQNVVSDANGVAHFTTKLQPGTFQVTETQAPTGYALPANPTQDVVVDAADLNNGETPVQVRFDDPPIGSLALSKAHQELSGGTWVPGDGQIAFNDQVKYVITVTATGTKVFHDVKVTDYVPGYNPADTQTQLGGFKAAIVGTPTCSVAFTTCSASYDTATGLVTWTLGDVGDTTGTVEFVVRMPDLPRVSPLAAPGVSFAGLMWNQAYLSWTQRDDSEGSAPHTLASNTVTDAASEVLPPKQIVSPPKQHHPSVLPSTGGPDGLWLAGGLALLLAGGALVMSDRRRRRRS